VQKLLDMGFVESNINNALRITNNSYEGACVWLLGERELASDDMVILFYFILNNKIKLTDSKNIIRIQVLQ
jgi:hypothetical protein